MGGCLTLYFLFYFLRDRFRVLKAIRPFLPKSGPSDSVSRN